MQRFSVYLKCWESIPCLAEPSSFRAALRLEKVKKSGNRIVEQPTTMSSDDDDWGGYSDSGSEFEEVLYLYSTKYPPPVASLRFCSATDILNQR